MNLQKMPLQERPRERLLSVGAAQLSLAELLAILLTTGTKKKSVLALAHEIVSVFGDKLLEASIEELMEIDGIGYAKAIQMQAVFAIATKMVSKKVILESRIEAVEAYELVKQELSFQKQEILMVILKDVKGRLIGVEKVAMGTLSDVLFHPREIFFPAVRHKASSLILAHNHPSGDPTPSPADIQLTTHLIQSGRIMGIYLDDHIIVGKNSFVSLHDFGVF
jgi:DNA repair protein RadC